MPLMGGWHPRLPLYFSNYEVYMNIELYHNPDCEILIDKNTGESYCSISGYSRLSDLDKSTISKRLSRGYKGVDKSKLKFAEILTPGGLQAVSLITEDIITDWIIDDNPEVAKKLLKAGVRLFLQNVAGYKYEPKKQLPEYTAKENVETAEAIERLSDPLIKSLLRQQLAEELGQKQLPMMVDTQRLVAVDVRARELGVPQSKINQAKQQGYWSLGSVVARDGRFESQGKVPLGSYMVHQYLITPELDKFIMDYFTE